MITETLIVGAGPVGLLLANLLGQAGMTCTIVEGRSAPPEDSRAIGITPPSLAILHRLELDGKLIQTGVRVVEAVVHDATRELGRVRFDGLPGPYRFMLAVPQKLTMELLAKNLQRFPNVTYRPGVVLQSLRQHSDHVTAGLGPTSESLRARFLIGCDGARSTVRKLAGIACARKQYRPRFAMGDFADQTEWSDAAHLFFTTRGSVESFPLPGGQRRWITPATTDLVGRVRDITGVDLSASRQFNHSEFQPELQLCDRYFTGRVILCGDAAHVMSPIGGQGMNTGFADAEFLATALCDGTTGLSDYNRQRHRAFRIAARRAAHGMWLGTRTGCVASALRSWFLRAVLLRPPVVHWLPAYFAMLTIPRGTRFSIGNRLDLPATKRQLNDQLFSLIADEYPFITRALSFGRDAAWKRRLVHELVDRPAAVCVDLACGTGDLTQLLASRYPQGTIIGLDLAAPMLARIRATMSNVHCLQADLGATGLRDGVADIVTGGYALRNAPDLDGALQEVYRILRPGGIAAFLDFSKPANRWGQSLALAALRFWGGFWGLLLHANPQVYTYIAASLRRFPDRQQLQARFIAHGLRVLQTRRFALGMVELLVVRR